MSSAEIISLQKIIDRLMPAGIKIPLRVVAIGMKARTSDVITFRAEAQIVPGVGPPYVEEQSITHVALHIHDKEMALHQCFEMLGRSLLNDAYMDLVGMHFPDVIDRYHREMHERYQMAVTALPTEIKVADPANPHQGFKDVTICGIPIHESLPISIIIHHALKKMKPPPTFDQEYLGEPFGEPFPRVDWKDPGSPADRLRLIQDLNAVGMISEESASELVNSMFPVVPNKAVPPGQMVFVDGNGKATVVKNISVEDIREGGTAFERAKKARIRIAFWRK